MSEKNMELAKRAMDSFNYSNFVLDGATLIPTLREFCDPDVEWDFSRRGVDPEIYHGYEGCESLSSSATPGRSFAWR